LQSDTLCQSFIYLGPNNALKSGVDLSTTIALQCPIFGGDVVKKKKQVENDCNNQLNDRQHPNYNSKDHTGQDQGAQVVLFGKDFDIVEEL
jgi:hypothetical protein